MQPAPPRQRFRHEPVMAAPVFPRREFVAVDGHVLAADVHLGTDDRPPVAFFHGILASLDVAPELFVDPGAESWISIGLPGHHPDRMPSTRRRPTVDAARFAALLDAALGQIVGSRPVIAAGWSTGGFAALALAIHHPRRVAAVASLAGFARGDRLRGGAAWLQWLAAAPAGGLLLGAGLAAAAHLPWLHDLAVHGCTADGATPLPAPTLARLRAAFARHDPASLVAMVQALGSLDVTSRLGEIEMPVWVAGGGRDPLVPCSETLRLARRIRRSTLRLYPDAGHLFFSEWPTVRADFAAWRREVAASGDPLP